MLLSAVNLFSNNELHEASSHVIDVKSFWLVLCAFIFASLAMFVFIGRLRLAHCAAATARLFLRHIAQHKLILRCSTWWSWLLFRPYTNFRALCWNHQKYVLHVLFCSVGCLFESFVHFVDFLLWSCCTLHVGYGDMPRELQCGNLASPLLLLGGSAAISYLMDRCFREDGLILLIQWNNKYHPGRLGKWVIAN